jgi:hypothetical protein
VSPRAAPLLAATVLAACGSGSPTATESTGAVTKPAYIEQADRLCTENNAAVAQAAEDAFGADAAHPSRKQLSAFLEDSVVPAQRQLLGELRALPPPSGDESELRTLFDSVQAGIDEVAADPDAAAADLGARSREILAEPRKLAQQYGFRACGAG